MSDSPIGTVADYPVVGAFIGATLALASGREEQLSSWLGVTRSSVARRALESRSLAS